MKKANSSTSVTKKKDSRNSETAGKSSASAAKEKKATPRKAATGTKSTAVKKEAAASSKKAKESPGKSAAAKKTAAEPKGKSTGKKAAAAKPKTATPGKETKATAKPKDGAAEKKVARKTTATQKATPEEGAAAKPKRGRPRKADQEAAAAAKQKKESEDKGPVLEPAAKEAPPKRKVKRAGRKRRARALPRVPDTIRGYPAWAEAWTALAETGLEAHVIPAVLRDASLIFNGLGELSAKSVEQLFQFWEIPEAPAGIESILEEAFLAQPPLPERKQQIEAFFREIMTRGDVHDALIFLWTARHLPEWPQASATLEVTGSPFHDDGTLFAIAREIVG